MADPRNIPKVFGIEKYSPCREWGLEQWFNALSARWNFRHYLADSYTELHSTPIPEDLLPDMREKFLGQVIQLLIDPIASSLERGVTPFLYNPSIVRNLNNNDLLMLHSVTGTGPCNDDICQMIGYNYSTRQREALNHLRFLVVDTSHSDAMLKAAFSKWLSSHSTPQTQYPLNTKKNFTENDFRSWHSSRILPYLDLQIWGRLSGIRITRKEIYDALFPGVPSDIDRIKTTERKAISLLQTENICALEAQMERERIAQDSQ